MAELSPVFIQQILDNNGDPLAGGKLNFYAAGTSVRKATYTDQSGATPNANPVVLDSAGRAKIWLGSGSYKVVCTDSADVEIWSEDNFTAPSATSTSTASGWTTHNVSDGQAATDLTSETVDHSLYSSALYEYEVIRGTTVVSNGQLAV